MDQRLTNWAGNVEFSANRVERPSSVEQLQELVAAGDRARVLGSGHSFNTIADTDGVLISLADLPESIEIDASAASVTVAGGVRYARLAPRLHEAGLALPAMASLPHISVVGGSATATHGSGDAIGNLATAVAGMEIVRADGELVRVDREDEHFDGAVVHLGAMGVVTAATLDVVPTFDVRQDVFEYLPFDAFVAHLDDVFASAYSVSVFTDWRGSRVNQVWVKRRVGDDWHDGPDGYGATAADAPRNPVPGMPSANCTPQLGTPGPWHERLPHFRAEFRPSSAAELQSEYLVPREHAASAVAAVHAARDHIAPVLQICELRTVAADTLWLSPTYRRDALAIHFTWVDDPGRVMETTKVVEERLRPFHPRPHWGKLFTLEPDEVRAVYPRLDDFRRLAAKHDPNGVFANDFMRTYVL